MITIIGTTHRLLSYVFGHAKMSEVDTPGTWLAYKGSVSHEGNDEESDASIILTGNAPGVSAEAAQWAVAEFEPQLLLSFAYGSAANEVSTVANLTLATSCIKIEGDPISWSESSPSTPIRTTANAYAVARKTVEQLGSDYRSGSIVSTNALTGTVQMKQWLNESYSIQAIDRDSYGIAQACTQGNVYEFMIIRPTLDPVDVPLPNFTRRLGQKPRGLLWPRVLAYLAGHPSETRSTFRLIGNANDGRRAIGRFVPRFLAEWSDLQSNGRSRNTA